MVANSNHQQETQSELIVIVSVKCGIFNIRTYSFPLKNEVHHARFKKKTTKEEYVG